MTGRRFREGEGKHHARYAAEDPFRSSSYPPQTPRGREHTRVPEGYEPNPFGQSPPDPMRSSMFTHSKPGYDDTRNVVYPNDSPMGTQYNKYKGVEAKASNASSEYRRAVSRFDPGRPAKGHQQLRDLATRAANLTAE